VDVMDGKWRHIVHVIGTSESDCFSDCRPTCWS
jgi:hypothetical protein